MLFALIDPTSEIGRRSGVHIWDGLQRRHTISASTASYSHRVAYLLCSFAAVKSWHFSAARRRTKPQRPQCKQIFLKAFSRQFLLPSVEYATAAFMYEVWLILSVKVKRVLGICKLWWVKEPPYPLLQQKEFPRPWLTGWFVLGPVWFFFERGARLLPVVLWRKRCSLQPSMPWGQGNRLSRKANPEVPSALGKFHGDLMGNSCQKGGYRLWIFLCNFPRTSFISIF